MFTRSFFPRHFLLQLYGTEPFLEYCELRKIPFAQVPGWVMREDEEWQWQEALRLLPASVQAQVELELSQVKELAHPHAIALITEAAQGRSLPSGSLAGEPAQALWFFLHHSRLFQEVFLQQEIAEVEAWRSARAPACIILDDLERKRSALASSLRDFFVAHEGTGRFCAVEVHALATSYSFFIRLSDRLRLWEVFTEEGKPTVQLARPSFSVLFVYYPSDGRVLLKARQRSRDRILELLQRFGRAVLDVELDERALLPAFRLDCLKRRFDPLPDAGDMEMARVRALHLAYPGRAARRWLKLETLGSDEQFAILELLKKHGGGPQVLEQLSVRYAELQVRLRVAGGSKNYPIRLWPDRCSLDHTPLGERFAACLIRWGITHGG